MRVLFPTMEGRTRETAHQLDLLTQESRALQVLISKIAAHLDGDTLKGLRLGAGSLLFSLDFRQNNWPTKAGTVIVVRKSHFCNEKKSSD